MESCPWWVWMIGLLQVAILGVVLTLGGLLVWLGARLRQELHLTRDDHDRRN
jgi:hypothetical protein